MERTDQAVSRHPGQRVRECWFAIVDAADPESGDGDRGRNLIRNPISGRSLRTALETPKPVDADLVASTVLYALPKTNPFEVRQMIHSNLTNVRILSRYFHNSM